MTDVDVSNWTSPKLAYRQHVGTSTS